MSMWRRNLLLGILVVVLAAFPVALHGMDNWRGADDRGTEAIQSVDASYQPWFSNIFEPSQYGLERYMFGAQALLGSAVTFGVVGWLVGHRRGLAGGGRGDLRTAAAVAGGALLIAAALVLVQTNNSEMQDFVSAVQGACLGFLVFFAGHWLGRRGAGHAPPAGTGQPTAAHS